MKVTKISAVTLPVSDMKKSVDFYSKIPNFKIVYGGSDSQFTSFLILFKHETTAAQSDGVWRIISTPFVFLADTFFVLHITKIGADKKSQLRARK